MKVFLTGATGFVGLNILTALLEHGHEVHLYARASSNRQHIEQFNATIHEGELDDLPRLKSVMSGMDAVIHTAGNTSCFAREYDALYQANVVGTKNIVDAALASGIKRLVYTSTTSTIGASDDRQVRADENTGLHGFRAKSPYALTKGLAEQEILRAHAAGLESIILNPAEIIGAFDHNFQWGRLVMAVFANQVPFLPPGGGSFCAAKDVAEAHVAALTQGQSGERYILGGDDRDYLAMLDIISDKLGKSFDKPGNNYQWLYFTQWCKEKFYPLLGKESMVEPYRMKVFAGFYFFDSQKAEKALGYHTAKLEDMLTDTIAWYRNNGILPPAGS